MRYVWFRCWLFLRLIIIIIIIIVTHTHVNANLCVYVWDLHLITFTRRLEWKFLVGCYLMRA